MTEELFPSGPWTGFYTYRNPQDRHRMDLALTFAHGRLTGGGTDDVGPFTIRGGYDPGSLEVTWVKAYATHTVDYRGWREGKGIWGRWTIGAFASGGFMIWPQGQGATEAEVVREALEVEAPPLQVR